MFINGAFVGPWSIQEQFKILVVSRFGLARRLASIVHGLYGTCHKCGGRRCSGCGACLSCGICDC